MCTAAHSFRSSVAKPADTSAIAQRTEVKLPARKACLTHHSLPLRTQRQQPPPATRARNVCGAESRKHCTKAAILQRPHDHDLPPIEIGTQEGSLQKTRPLSSGGGQEDERPSRRLLIYAWKAVGGASLDWNSRVTAADRASTGSAGATEHRRRFEVHTFIGCLGLASARALPRARAQKSRHSRPRHRPRCFEPGRFSIQGAPSSRQRSDHEPNSSSRR